MSIVCLPCIVLYITPFHTVHSRCSACTLFMGYTSCWKWLSLSSELRQIICPHCLCNCIMSLSSMPHLVPLLLNRLLIHAISWQIITLIKPHVVPINIWVIECISIEMVDEIMEGTQCCGYAGLDVQLYSGSCSRMRHWPFNTPKMCSIMF